MTLGSLVPRLADTGILVDTIMTSRSILAGITGTLIDICRESKDEQVEIYYMESVTLLSKNVCTKPRSGTQNISDMHLAGYGYIEK